MKTPIAIALVVATLFSFYNAHAQLSGTYTIGGTNPDYTTFNDALTALNSQGISSNVVFNVRDGVYNEKFNVGSITGTSANSSITFQSETGDSIACRLEYPSDGATTNWGLNGAHYITFDGLGFRNTSDSTFWDLVEANTGNVHDVTFNRCHFSSADGGSDYMIYLYPDSINNITVENSFFDTCDEGFYSSPGVYAANFNIHHNTFSSNYYGIELDYCNHIQVNNNIIRNSSEGILYSYGDTAWIENNLIDSSWYYGIYGDYPAVSYITNNRLLDTSYYGIYVDYATGSPTVADNNFIENASYYGIYFYSLYDGEIKNDTINNSYEAIEVDEPYKMHIENNVIHGFSDYGIYLYYTYDNAYVNNNFLDNTSEPGSSAEGLYFDDVYGIDSSVVTDNILWADSGSTGIYMNSMGATDTTTSLVANNIVSGYWQAIYASGSEYQEYAHNTFYNNSGNYDFIVFEGGDHNSFINNIVDDESPDSSYSIFSLSFDSVIYMHNNIYHYNDGSAGVNLTTDAHSLADWQGMGYDANSQLADPMFTAVPFNLLPTNCSIAHDGSALPQVHKDITGNTRDASAPTPGAYELVAGAANAAFTYTNIGATYTFTNGSTNANSYLWDFGDGATSSQLNPTHTYTSEDSYTVQLTAINTCGTNDITSEDIDVLIGLNDLKLGSTNIYPNPASGIVNITFPSATESLNLEVLDLSGRRYLQQQINAGDQSHIIDVSNLANGIYLVKLSGENFNAIQKISVVH